MKSFFDNLFGKKPEPPKIQKRNEPPQREDDDFYKKGDLIGGEYEVRGTLGKGGFGHVYLVRHSKLEVVYALKTFRDEFLDDPKARDSFKKEVSLWVNLEDHPFILPAKIVHEFSGRLFVFMEYIEPDAKGRINLAKISIATCTHASKFCLPPGSASGKIGGGSGEGTAMFCLPPGSASGKIGLV
jgi:hypothetical protein